jgi:threonine/homoserine/homoserine lactone efflux protein
MPDAAQLLSFLVAAVLITATPGPDNLMVLGMGVSRGRRQGIAFGLGCAAGCLSHTLLAVVGVSALVAASPLAFTALKWLGGGYLVWLGVQAIRHAGQGVAAATPVAAADARGAAADALSGPSGPSDRSDGAAGAAARAAFLRGLVANAVNPKVVLFFLSFLPQFVVPGQGAVSTQLGVLGVVFALQAALLFGLLGWFSGGIGAWLARRPQAAAWLDRVAGGVFIALGLRMVASR